jgi:mono/diheme cytochrome c family protein
MRRAAHLNVVLLLGAVHGASAADLPPPARVQVDFARDIKPILQRSCLSCHGADRPKGGLRLDNRDAALKGGDSGRAILPGDSTNSPLVLIVAGLHDEIERMPPKGKGDPLTAEEIGLLRAWIDQGADWPEAAFAGPQSIASAAVMVRWISLGGDEHKFREHFWMKEGVHAGLQNFYIQERPSPDSTVTLQGRLFPAERDIRLALRYERANVGFIDVGLDQYPKYYDDSGGFYPFVQPLFSLDRNLALRSGKAWLDFGLTLPDAPKVALGYEYHFRQGTKSTLQWGLVDAGSPVFPPDSSQRNIYPAFKEVDEAVHLLKFDASHEVDGLYVEDNFRAEFYDLNTHRQNVVSMTAGQTAPTIFELVDESHNEFHAVNAFRFENEIRDWWLVSGGYLHSHADADASFRQSTVHASGLPIVGDFWRSRALILSQNSVLLNANTRLGPWKDLTFSGGVQSEWMRQEGVGNVSLETAVPPIIYNPITVDANLRQHTLEENARLQYTGLPFTSLFAEGRMEQDNFHEEASGIFARETEATGNLADWRVGGYSSPHRLVSLGAHYRNRDKHTRYDHTNGPSGYPAFIRDRRIDTHEIEARLTIRPVRWLKTTFTYQVVDTDFDSETKRGTTNAVPGGTLDAGAFNANVYGLNLILTPFSRWNFSGTFNYYDSRSASSHNDVRSVQPYRGGIYSLLATATYMLSTNTDVTASYNFSRADYAQNNFREGLPLGIEYDWHVVQAGIARRFRRASLNLQYAFYQYAEPTSGGFNDYTAHAVFTTLTLHLP